MNSDLHSPGPSLVIVGNPDPIHIGAHLENAAQALGLSATLADAREAYAGFRWWVAWNWRLRGRRPSRLEAFGDHVVDLCRAVRPKRLLTTGIAPLSARALDAVRALGVELLNYLTDDPWNPAHRASWFLEALPRYDRIFTPRRANVPDLAGAGARDVRYLPFAYAPTIHFPEPPVGVEEHRRFDADIVFAGGADRDRLAPMEALSDAGLKVAVYGGYWDRARSLRSLWRGHADPSTLRKAVCAARVSLCLVRRANRDGHSMRTFEVPAMGGCVLAEDTAEHREIFGREGKAVLYFGSIVEMVEKARKLVDRADERDRLAGAAHKLIIGGRNTYRDRLSAMFGLDGLAPLEGRKSTRQAP